MAESKIHELDFIKGLAILSVILLHTISRNALYTTYAFFHIWQAVPLFVFVSYYLLFVKFGKKISVNSYFSKSTIKKTLKRVVLPFVIIELLVIIISVLFSLPMSILGIIGYLGVGPGSYYPYIYMQLWLSAPFIFLLLSSVKYGGVILFVICIILNFIGCYYIHSDRIYSCLFIRYLFIGFLAYQWYQRKMRICL